MRRKWVQTQRNVAQQPQPLPHHRHCNSCSIATAQVYKWAAYAKPYAHINAHTNIYNRECVFKQMEAPFCGAHIVLHMLQAVVPITIIAITVATAAAAAAAAASVVVALRVFVTCSGDVNFPITTKFTRQPALDCTRLLQRSASSAVHHQSATQLCNCLRKRLVAAGRSTYAHILRCKNTARYSALPMCSAAVIAMQCRRAVLSQCHFSLNTFGQFVRQRRYRYCLCCVSIKCELVFHECCYCICHHFALTNIGVLIKFNLIALNFSANGKVKLLVISLTTRIKSTPASRFSFTT